MATPGNVIYRDLGESLARARGEVDRVSRELEAASSEREQLQVDEARGLAELAGVRLEALAAQPIVDGLDAADRRALELLERKRAAAERTREDIAASQQRERELEAAREEARAALDAAETAHDARVEATLARLAELESYESQRARVERATSQAALADEKARRAEADRIEKGEPYERDKLFSYLWRRRYRFPEYRANRLTRALDGWVARLCHYDRAHRDYGLLIEIPKRLRTHADDLAADATIETEALAKIEAEAFAADGVPELAAALAERREELAAAEDRIDDEERRYAELVAARAALDAGDDPHTTEALRTLTGQLQREDVATLRADAARTRSAEDDRLVDRLADLRARLRDVEDRLDARRAEHDSALAGLRDLEEMRRRFRRHGYDSRDAMFDDDFDAGDLFAGLLSGAFAFGDAWARVGRHHRYRRRSSSNSAASIAGSILGGLLSGSRSSGGGGFRGGGFGGGGFRSGGGFGGGGFKTGGGF